MLRHKTYASVRLQLYCALVQDLPPEFYDVIGILVVFILVTRFALASLPWTEATVNSVLYGFGRAWQLTRYLAKALARCVCCVPPHKSPSRKPKWFPLLG